MDKFFKNFFLKTSTKIILDCIMLAFSFISTLIVKYDVRWHRYISIKDFFVYTDKIFEILNNFLYHQLL